MNNVKFETTTKACSHLDNAKNNYFFFKQIFPLQLQHNLKSISIFFSQEAHGNQY